jgi:DNA-binding PadR family transcriptional regulator
MLRPHASEAFEYLPLRAPVFAVLAALAGGPTAGIDVLDCVNATVRKRTILGPGTFYRLMRELRQSGLIAAAHPPPRASARDDRQTHHELTRLGRAVLAAEVDRLKRTMAMLSRSPRPVSHG